MYPMFPQAVLTCGCSWIDKQGNPTPDNYEAIAMAVCHDPLSFGEKGSDPFPICEIHAQRKTRYWKLLPLPGKTVEESHLLVKVDHATFQRPLPDVVVEAIKKAFPDHTKDYTNNLLHEVKWDHLNRCFFFVKWGMYVGVEEDGHIHT